MRRKITFITIAVIIFLIGGGIYFRSVIGLLVSPYLDNQSLDWTLRQSTRKAERITTPLDQLPLALASQPFDYDEKIISPDGNLYAIASREAYSCLDSCSTYIKIRIRSLLGQAYSATIGVYNTTLDLRPEQKDEIRWSSDGENLYLIDHKFDFETDKLSYPPEVYKIPVYEYEENLR